MRPKVVVKRLERRERYSRLKVICAGFFIHAPCQHQRYSRSTLDKQVHDDIGLGVMLASLACKVGVQPVIGGGGVHLILDSSGPCIQFTFQ